MKKKLLLFGAGKIGRSFIAQIFSKAGYEIVFIDISQTLVDQLNQKKKYPVYIKDTQEETLWVENVRALHSSQQEEIVEEIVQCPLIAVSAGRNGLPAIAQILSRGIWQKYQGSAFEKTDIVMAENLRDADLFMKNEMMKHLPADFPFDSSVGIQETSIGKMVPIIPEEILNQDPLAVYAEAYNTLIVSSGFLNEAPEAEGLSLKNNIKAWVDRKQFIHNLGHSVAAYVGNYLLPQKEFIYEVLENEKVESIARSAMGEAARILQSIHPAEFSDEHLENHIDDLIRRFKNVALGDTVFRVGCDLERKLSYDDRYLSPIRHARQFNLPYSNIAFGYFCAMHFKARSDQGTSLPKDIEIVKEYEEKNVEHVLQKYSGMNHLEAAEISKEMQKLNVKLN